jgi:pimeloyl-ACP methyl ester carboxylesterase
VTLRVPLNHDEPEGESIEVFLSHRPGNGAQLWLLQGGPGASAESFYNFYGFLDAVDPELDIYTLEHRGVGDATRLGCSAEAAGTPDGFQISAGEWPDCLTEVKAAWGDRLAHFSTTQAAHDLALAIDRTRRPGQRSFVYGISYGSFWAHRYAVLYPEQSAGVVLDGPVQPEATLEDYDTWFEPVGRAVFEDLCPAAPRCAAALGDDPWAFFEQTYASLAAGHCRSLGVDLETWRIVFALFLMDHTLQDTWPRYAADPLADAYAPPDLPMLTMAGRYDPAAPPALVATGYREHLTGPHQTYVEMPYGAHGVLTGSPVDDGLPPCPFQLFRAFLADPTAPLPVNCVDHVQGPTFDAPPELATRYWGTSDLYE